MGLVVGAANKEDGMCQGNWPLGLLWKEAGEGEGRPANLMHM